MSASGADLSSTYARAYTKPTVIIAGDSITAQDSVAGPTYVDFAVVPGPVGTGSQGYMTWAQSLSGHRLKLLRNAGVGGNTSAQLLARLQADVIAYAPTWCVVLIGANDITSDTPYATVTANLVSIWTALQQAGIKVIACTITPTTYASTTARRQTLHRVNNFIRRYARAVGGIVLCDWHAAVADPATGNPVTTYFRTEVDSGQVHPNAIGARHLGSVLAGVISSVVPALPMLPGSNADPDNMVTNACLTGTTGTNGAGVGITGSVPTGYTLFSATGTTPTATLSTPARTDGIQGNWFQIAFTAGNAAELHLLWQDLAASGHWAIGDVVTAVCEYQTDADWVGGVAAPNVNLNFFGSAGNSVNDFRRNSSDSGWADPVALSGVLRTMPVAIPAGTTKLQLSIGAQCSTGTLRLGRIALYNLTAMGLSDL